MVAPSGGNECGWTWLSSSAAAAAPLHRHRGDIVLFSCSECAGPGGDGSEEGFSSQEGREEKKGGGRQAA